MVHEIDPRPICGYGVGDMVVYKGTFNEQVRWGSCDDPRECLVEGNEYEVSAIEVHGWHINVSVKGFDEKKFPSPAFKLKGGQA
ncbi:hypothetical protein FACS189447_03080 [Spirochaetia bacterium]|nr:hypothetical protein FACS189447_03080 [Spirochaetia bacterium]